MGHNPLAPHIKMVKMVNFGLLNFNLKQKNLRENLHDILYKTCTNTSLGVYMNVHFFMHSAQ